MIFQLSPLVGYVFFVGETNIRDLMVETPMFEGGDIHTYIYIFMRVCISGQIARIHELELRAGRF